MMENLVLDLINKKDSNGEKLLIISIFKQALDDAMMYKNPRYLPGLIENAKKKRFDQSVYSVLVYFTIYNMVHNFSYMLYNTNIFIAFDVLKTIAYKRQQREKFRLMKLKNKNFQKKWNHYYRRRQLEELAYEAREWLSIECDLFNYYCDLLDIDPKYAQNKMHKLVEEFDHGIYQPKVNYIF